MPGVGTFYYLLELGAFCAALWFAAKGQRNDAGDRAIHTLAETQANTITAQAERIAVLEAENKSLKGVIEKQDERINYLEEIVGIHGHPKVV